MQEELVNLLIEKKLTITTAESCTGGMVSSKIVDVAGSSKVLNMAFVTYSNDAKEKLIGVKEETLNKYGAVSQEVAYQMALGAKKTANSDVSIATTGIAGPGGGSKDKPVGMVCFGFCVFDKVVTETVYFSDLGRNNVRQEAAEYAINKMIYLIKEGK